MSVDTTTLHAHPPNHPRAKRRRLHVGGATTPRRTAASIAASAAAVQNARRSGASKAAVSALAQEKGFKGHSLFLAPRPEDKARYPSLKNMWSKGPDLLPYDTMHVILLDVVPRLRELFAGESDKLGEDRPWLLFNADREAIGREIKAGCPTMPLNKARSLRKISKHYRSFKAVD